MWGIFLSLQDWVVMAKVTNTRIEAKTGLTPKKKLSTQLFGESGEYILGFLLRCPLKVTELKMVKTV